MRCMVALMLEKVAERTVLDSDMLFLKRIYSTLALYPYPFALRPAARSAPNSAADVDAFTSSCSCSSYFQSQLFRCASIFFSSSLYEVSAQNYFTVLCNTHFSCTEKSSVVSSSSQLSSQRCVFVPCAPTSSSLAQSKIAGQLVLYHSPERSVPSTGKSSNSSSSSSCAAGFCG